jgi:hypothetical protein
MDMKVLYCGRCRARRETRSETQCPTCASTRVTFVLDDTRAALAAMPVRLDSLHVRPSAGVAWHLRAAWRAVRGV